MKKNKFIMLFLVTVIILITVTFYGKKYSNTNSNTKEIVENLEKTEETKEEIKEETEQIVVEEIDEIEQIVKEMTLEEKVGQMFITTPETFNNNQIVTSFNQLDTEQIKKYNIGGFILFANNILNPTQLKDLTLQISNINEKYKMFISIDEEGGQVARISNNINFPDKKIINMSEIGTDVTKAYEIGNTIGNYLNNYGLNLNFAPVCDVLLNSQNTVVKKRSFGQNGDIVANMSLNLMNGLKDNKILACAKHFPGHGNTALDTHYGFATSNATLEQMEKDELIPFKLLIKNNVDMVMISHVIYPQLSNVEVPATLNYDIVTKLLKENLNYEGVIITDGMNMGAIVNNYTVEQSTVMSVNAGVDIILMPSDFFIAYESVIKAVNSGEISEKTINESVYKILKLKQNL